MARSGRDDSGGRPPRPGRPAPRDHHPPRRAAPPASLRAADGPAPVRLQRQAGAVTLWGFHAVAAALRSPRRTPLRLLATEAAAARLADLVQARGLTPVTVSGADLDRLLPRDAVHQGVALEAMPLDQLDVSDLPDRGLVVVLDQVTDPHNVGAILRTAAAFGVSALVTTERHAPEMTGVLAKAASGGLEHVPIVAVGNLARALDQMTRAGYAVIGLDSEGDTTLEAVHPAAALALVLGAEGKGLRRLTRERCTTVARLDMPGEIKSLNVSNACAVALAVLRMRGAGTAG